MTPAQILLLGLIVVLYGVGVGVLDRALDGRGRLRGLFRIAAVAAPFVAYGLTMQRSLAGQPLLGLKFTADYERIIDWTKMLLAVVAAIAVFYEAHRAGMRRPIAARWKKLVGVSLGLAAICAYFNGYPFATRAFTWAQYYHRWDQFHYYMGAKYFREMGYDGLYKCTAIAEDELGTVSWEENGRTQRLDLKKELAHPDKKIRNLGGDNLLIPVGPVLEHPELCRDKFSPARWQDFKEDVRFFRLSSDKGYWTDMQTDHGYNPPPVWTVGGKLFASMYPAGHSFDLPVIGKVIWLQILSMLDIAYLAGVFVLLYWAFGWRTFAVAAIFWGTQSSAPNYWTAGAFLRQDWLFFLVLSAAALRKRMPKLAGASLVYSGLLRVFPGLVVIAWLMVAGFHVWRHRHAPDRRHAPLAAALAAVAGLAAAAVYFVHGNPVHAAVAGVAVAAGGVAFYRFVAPRMHLVHQKVLVGGIAAAAVLVPTSWAVAGTDSYQQFYEHTIKVHDHTPLTNHMGLRVLVAVRPGCISDFPPGWCTGLGSGRMKWVTDSKLADPFATWKQMREDRYAKYRLVAYGIIAASLVAFAFVVRRIRSLWVAECLGQIWIILLSQLTCYYYSFMILVAPLTRLRRQLEAPLFGLAALSQLIWVSSNFYDDRYTALSFVSLAYCFWMLWVFGRKRDLAALRARLSRGSSSAEAPPVAGASPPAG
jgi:hypothetical protein